MPYKPDPNLIQIRGDAAYAAALDRLIELCPGVTSRSELAMVALREMAARLEAPLPARRKPGRPRKSPAPTSAGGPARDVR